MVEKAVPIVVVAIEVAAAVAAFEDSDGGF